MGTRGKIKKRQRNEIRDQLILPFLVHNIYSNQELKRPTHIWETYILQRFLEHSIYSNQELMKLNKIKTRRKGE